MCVPVKVYWHWHAFFLMAVQMRLIHKCLSWWQCNLSHFFLLVHSGHVKIDDFFRVLRLKACSFTERVSCEVLCINFSCNNWSKIWMLVSFLASPWVFHLCPFFPSTRLTGNLICYFFLTFVMELEKHVQLYLCLLDL